MVEGRLLSQQPNAGGDRGLICPGMVLRTLVQVRMAFPLLFQEQWEGAVKAVGPAHCDGEDPTGQGRGRNVLELIGALQARGVPQSSPLQKGLASRASGLCAYDSVCSLSTDHHTSCPRTDREPLWSSGFSSVQGWTCSVFLRVR